jgi:hypothetical protein
MPENKASENPLLNPRFRYGVAAMSTLAIVIVAFLFVDDTTVRVAMLAVGVLDLLVTPRILKLAAEQDSPSSP